MYFGIDNNGCEFVVDDAFWKDNYKDAKAVGLNHCVAYVKAGWIYFYFPGTPFGYGGDLTEDWLKKQSYGKWRSTHICQIKNTRVEWELYGDDDAHIVRLGNIRFTYRQVYPGNNMALDLDTVDGMKIEYGKYGYISKVGPHTIKIED